MKSLASKLRSCGATREKMLPGYNSLRQLLRGFRLKKVSSSQRVILRREAISDLFFTCPALQLGQFDFRNLLSSSWPLLALHQPPVCLRTVLLATDTRVIVSGSHRKTAIATPCGPQNAILCFHVLLEVCLS